MTRGAPPAHIELVSIVVLQHGVATGSYCSTPPFYITSSVTNLPRVDWTAAHSCLSARTFIHPSTSRRTKASIHPADIQFAAAVCSSYQRRIVRCRIEADRRSDGRRRHNISYIHSARVMRNCGIVNEME